MHVLPPIWLITSAYWFSAPMALMTPVLDGVDALDSVPQPAVTTATAAQVASTAANRSLRTMTSNVS